MGFRCDEDDDGDRRKETGSSFVGVFPSAVCMCVLCVRERECGCVYACVRCVRGSCEEALECAALFG